MQRVLVVVLVAAGSLTAVASATAVPPVVISVALQDRHPVVVFSAPRASGGTIYLASNPARATDGRFLDENVEELDILTETEVQSGRWLYERRIDPGTYWVMLRADDDFSSCWNSNAGAIDPACADGYSNIAQLDVPKPSVRFNASARARFWTYSAPDLTLTLTARPLGENRAYRVCWRQMVRARYAWRQVCRRGTLNGYSWDDATTDTLSFAYNETRMARMTTFNWYVGRTKVASRRTQTCRCH